MQKLFLALAAALVMAAMPTSAGDVLATGHIQAGAPTTMAVTTSEILSESTGIDSFFFEAPVAGTVLTTVTVDNGGLGYDLDVYFFGADSSFLGGCYTEAPDEVCAVPVGAASVEIAAYAGFDLDVTVTTV